MLIKQKVRFYKKKKNHHQNNLKSDKKELHNVAANKYLGKERYNYTMLQQISILAANKYLGKCLSTRQLVTVLSAANCSVWSSNLWMCKIKISETTGHDD